MNQKRNKSKNLIKFKNNDDADDKTDKWKWLIYELSNIKELSLFLINWLDYILLFR